MEKYIVATMSIRSNSTNKAGDTANEAGVEWRHDSRSCIGCPAGWHCYLMVIDGAPSLMMARVA